MFRMFRPNKEQKNTELQPEVYTASVHLILKDHWYPLQCPLVQAVIHWNGPSTNTGSGLETKPSFGD